MFGLDQVGGKFDRFLLYFQTSNDLLMTILMVGIGVFVTMVVMLRLSMMVMDQADRKKLAEFDKELD